MATRVKPRPDLHGEDLYAWSKAQADLLRAGRFGDLDLAHLIEEIEDVGGAMRRAARNSIRTIMEHMLKLEHSPTTEARAGWRATIRSQRVRLAAGALHDHGEDAAANSLPVACPYSVDQITDGCLRRHG